MSKQTILMTIVCSETIRELRSVPSGELYASLMVHNVTMDEYNAIIGSLKRAQLIEEKHNVLSWIGPLLTQKGT